MDSDPNKKRIIFILPFMYVGGVERSFLNLLKKLDPHEYDIHLGLLKLEGQLLDRVPAHVTIHHIKYYDRYMPVIKGSPLENTKRLLKDKSFKSLALYLFACLGNKIRGTGYYLYKLVINGGAPLADDYDIAIAYAGPSPMIDFFVANKIKAAKKIGWIHFDISRFGCDKMFIRKIYKNFEHINIVSHEAKRVFDATFPELKNKTRVQYNYIDEAAILHSSLRGETFEEDGSVIKILTVGRLSREKGQDLAIDVAKKLKDKGISFVWYFIGDGEMMDRYKNYAEGMEVNDVVKFLGAKENPYRYMKDCDIYVQPSRYEAFGITIAEAKCLGKYIIATDFCGAREQLENYPNSSICKADVESITNEIFQRIDARGLVW